MYSSNKTKEIKSDKLRKIPYLEMFKIRGVFAFAFTFFLMKDVLFGIYYWYPTFLQSQIHFTKNDALDIFSLFSTGTFIGCIAFGLFSDMFSMRSPVMLSGMLATTILMFILAFDSGYHANQPSSEFKYGSITFLIGACMYGPQIIILAVECDITDQIERE